MWRGGQSIPTASPTMVPYPGRMVDRLSLSRVWSLGVQGDWARRRVPLGVRPSSLGPCRAAREWAEVDSGLASLPSSSSRRKRGGGPQQLPSLSQCPHAAQRMASWR